MVQITLPMHRSEWDKMGVMKEGSPFITTLGLVGGEILQLLERKGSQCLSEIVKEIEWPEAIVMMSAGALIREGVIEARRLEDKILLAA